MISQSEVKFDDGIAAAEAEAEMLLEGPVLQVDAHRGEVAIDRVDDDGDFVERVFFEADD